VELGAHCASAHSVSAPNVVCRESARVDASADFTDVKSRCVQDLGELSVRGEILDIYPYLAENRAIASVLSGTLTLESIKEFRTFFSAAFGARSSARVGAVSTGMNAATRRGWI